MLSRRSFLTASATVAGGLILSACNGGKAQTAATATTGPLATLAADPQWKVSLPGARITDYQPRLGVLAVTAGKGGKSATLSAVSGSGTTGWKVNVDTDDASKIDLAWIATATADMVAAHDKGAGSLTVWLARSTKAALTLKVSDALLGAAGLVALLEDGTIKTLTLTGGTTPYMTALDFGGTVLASTTTGRYLTLDSSKALCLNNVPLTGAGKGTPDAVTLTQSGTAACWSGSTVAWDLDGNRLAYVDSAITPGRRPVTGGDWSAWGALAWPTSSGDGVPLTSNPTAVLDGAAYCAAESGTDVVDLSSKTQVTKGSTQPIGAPVDQQHLVTYDGKTLTSWPLLTAQEATTAASSTPAAKA